GQSPLRDSTIQKRNVKYSVLAKQNTLRIHDFRHSHASLLANEGINIQEIARRLGHSKIEITWNTYAHLYPREEERAIQVLDKIV
ncbi:MAG: tyrosine-type recombinase/integrase, partial [Oscillospiraceae bacterium]|nr:tyrosine-type recombinase/integrase [Oscillospiraceae bacterium]